MSTSRGPEPPVVGERRRSRERALEILYEAECKDAALSGLADAAGRDGRDGRAGRVGGAGGAGGADRAEPDGMTFDQLVAELPVAPEPYARQLVLGVERRLGTIDDLLDRHATGWPLDRMPAVDRSLLRIATYELLEETSVPVAVVIDEAVELAKSYSTEDSGRYVNGVLSAIAGVVRGGGAGRSSGLSTDRSPGRSPGRSTGRSSGRGS